MIRSILFDPETKKANAGNEDQIARWEASENSLIWLDISRESADLASDYLKRFKIHELAIQDALRDRHPPKFEEFEDFTFILYKGLDASTVDMGFGVIQLSLFVSDRFFITFHRNPSVSADYLYGKLSASLDDCTVLSPAALALDLSGRLVRRYVEILLELEPRLEELEQEMFDKLDDSILAELSGYKTKLRNITRISTYHLQLLNELKKGKSKYFPDVVQHHIVEVYEQVERSLSLANLYYDVASDLTDGYLALASHRLNSVMRILTVITVIFVPLTFLAGIYGMNFDNMPELHSPVGYFVVIAVMAVVAIAQLIIFRRRGWL